MRETKSSRKKSTSSVLDELVEAGNGYIQTARVLENGISKPSLAAYAEKQHLQRVARGIYLAEDAWPDDLYLLSLTCSRIVYSHETALQLHGLTEREPGFISVTVKAGYNATHLRKKGIRVFQARPDFAEQGVMEVKTAFGNPVRVYDMDRTICDLIQNKQATDIQVFQYALKEYMANSQKNLSHLMMYAKKYRLDMIVRTYLEVLL